MALIKKKPFNWICSCGRKNGPADVKCGFCKQVQPEGKVVAKIKKTAAYDELVLWPIFSLYIRLRDSDNNGTGFCFTCKRPVHYTKADCGHGIGRQHKGVKYNEQNNHIQCKPCNGFHGGMRERYKEEMDKRYGKGTWDRMEVAARAPSKLGKVAVDMLAAHFQKEVDRLLATKTDESRNQNKRPGQRPGHKSIATDRESDGDMHTENEKSLS